MTGELLGKKGGEAPSRNDKAHSQKSYCGPKAVNNPPRSGLVQLTGIVNKDVPKDVQILPMQFGITLNRLGNFTMELEATDKISGKSAKTRLPLKVVAVD